MASSLQVAAVQFRSSADKAANIERMERLVADAASLGADAVVLPERWNVSGSPEILLENAEPLDGQTGMAMRDWSRRHAIFLVGGSITELGETPGRLSNTSAVFDREGLLTAIYRKIHLFDVDVGGQTYRESETDDPGEEIVTCDVDGWSAGLSICYDLRFAELYRILALRGCELVAVPADFTLHTGKDHWELLVRARAVENQYFVVAAGQWGQREDGKTAFGRSMIVDPWGVVLAQAPDEDCVISARISKATIDRVRASIPSLRNRRPTAYDCVSASSLLAAGE